MFLNINKTSYTQNLHKKIIQILIYQHSFFTKWRTRCLECEETPDTPITSLMRLSSQETPLPTWLEAKIGEKLLLLESIWGGHGEHVERLHTHTPAARLLYVFRDVAAFLLNSLLWALVGCQVWLGEETIDNCCGSLLVWTSQQCRVWVAMHHHWESSHLCWQTSKILLCHVINTRKPWYKQIIKTTNLRWCTGKAVHTVRRESL